jgi:hypothetical protein
LLVPGVFLTLCSFEDVNMEHADFLFFLFHQLPLLAKRSVLAQASTAIVECVEAIDDM